MKLQIDKAPWAIVKHGLPPLGFRVREDTGNPIRVGEVEVAGEIADDRETPATVTWSVGQAEPVEGPAPLSFGVRLSALLNFRKSISAKDDAEPANVMSSEVLSVSVEQTGAEGRAFAIGGRSGGGPTYPWVYEYDPQLDTWNTRADMPWSVIQAGVVAHEGKIYVFGGQHAYAEWSREWTRRVQIYDIDADSWSEGPEMPDLLNYIGAVVREGAAYLFSRAIRDDETSSWLPPETVSRFEFATGEWTSLAFTPPCKILAHGTIGLIGHHVYLVDTWDEQNAATREACRVDLLGR